MNVAAERLSELRSVSQLLRNDPFFIDAVEQLVWRIQDTEDTLTNAERREYAAAIALKIRAQLCEGVIAQHSELSDMDVAEIWGAAVVAAWDSANTAPANYVLH